MSTNKTNKLIEQSVNVAQRCQRNYDLSKSIPNNDLDTIIHAARNAPTKQNENHFSIYVCTNQEIINKIYNQTKLFLLMDDDKSDYFGEKDGIFWQKESYSVNNSQVLANAVLIYFEDIKNLRCGTHIQATRETSELSESRKILNEQVNYSIGIPVGQAILASAMLGYKTGICSAFHKKEVAEILETEKEAKLCVGIGFENKEIDRRYHSKTRNLEVPEKFRNGNLDGKWRFPSFDKTTSVNLNGKEI